MAPSAILHLRRLHDALAPGWQRAPQVPDRTAARPDTGVAPVGHVVVPEDLHLAGQLDAVAVGIVDEHEHVVTRPVTTGSPGDRHAHCREAVAPRPHVGPRADLE